MAQAPQSIDSILTLLETIPDTITQTTFDLRETDFTRRPDPEQWSLVEIVAHLRASGEIRGEQRIERMLREDEPTIRTESPRNISLTADYAAVPFGELFQAYVEQRERLLAQLRALGPRDWNRGAFLTGIRPPRYGTVHTETDAIVRHEVRHLAQIKRTTALVRSLADMPSRGRQHAPIRNSRSLVGI
jgi:hypothetical protein